MSVPKTRKLNYLTLANKILVIEQYDKAKILIRAVVDQFSFGKTQVSSGVTSV